MVASGPSGPVVVGVDGSSASLAALDLAVGEARLRDAPLLILYGELHRGPVRLWRTRTGPGIRSGIRRLLEAVADQARGRAPGLDVSVDLVVDEPGRALVAWSTRARMLVVGHSGRGGAALGSVAAYVASHAECPVLVDRPVASGRPALSKRPVVVGVDGSELSAAALEFAVTEANLRGAELTAVHVWSQPPGGAPGGLHPAEYDYPEARAEAERMLAEQLAGALAANPDVRVTRDVVHSLDVAHTLVELSGRGQLMVVGSRGRGGVTRLLLGSVSTALVGRAACPVAVVRPESLDRWPIATRNATDRSARVSHG